MTLEAALAAVLETVCPRVFPDFAPTSTARPYITYQQIGGEAPVYVDDTVPNVENGFMQVNCWDTTRGGAKRLARAVEAAVITAAAFQGRPMAALIAESDDELGLRGTRQDFTIWMGG